MAWSYDFMLKLTLASGATALGSVLSFLFFQAEDVAPGLDCISVTGVKRASHVAQQGMGNLVNGGHQ
jgi:hypothetical protein